MKSQIVHSIGEVTEIGYDIDADKMHRLRNVS